MLKKTMITISYLLTFIFLALLGLTFLWPEYLAYIKINVAQAKLITVFIVSVLLLLNSMVSNLSIFWKIICAVLSVIVLLEFVLMNNWWQGLIR